MDENTLLRAVIDSLPNHIFVKDLTGRYVLVNQAYTRFLGVATPAAIIGKTVFDFHSPQRAAEYQAVDEVVLRTGQIMANREGTLVDQAGNQRCYLTTKAPLRNDQGEIIGLVGISHDITERRQIEQERQEQEYFIRQVLDTSPHLIFVKDGAGNFILVNQAIANLFGMSKEELIYQNNGAVHDQPHEVAQYALIDQQVIKTQQIVSVEEAFTQPDGQPRWYYTIKAPLRQANGSINVLGISTDITEHRAMIEALRQSEARHRALLEAVPDAILRIDSNGTYLDIKEPTNFKSIQPTAELVGKQQRDTLPLAVAQQVVYYNDKALATGEIQSFEYALPIDGKTYIRESRVVPVGHDEVIVIVRDVTQRKQAEAEHTRLLTTVVEQHEQLRALSRRLAEIQEAERKAIARDLHDLIGQNLTALGLTLKLIQTQLPATLTSSQQLKAQLQDAIGLVTQTTSAIRSMMTELRPPVLDDYGLLAALRWYGSQVTNRTGLKIEVYGDAEQTRFSESVENALFRIAQEALTNVVKHAQATQVTVMLALTDDHVRLQIADNGRGFDPAALSPTARTGWGLLNMRERAEAIGGCCEISSQPQAGTRVWVEVRR